MCLPSVVDNSESLGYVVERRSGGRVFGPALLHEVDDRGMDAGIVADRNGAVVRLTLGTDTLDDNCKLI